MRTALNLHALTHLAAELLIPNLTADAEVQPRDVTRDLLQWVERLAPFGTGNPEPTFLSRNLLLIGPPRLIKEKHVCLPLEGGINAMGWSRAGHATWSERLQPLNLSSGSRFDAVFRLRENKHPQYGGLELDLIDLAPVSG